MSSNFRVLTSRSVMFHDIPTMNEWDEATRVDLGQTNSRRLGLRTGSRGMPTQDVGTGGDESFQLLTNVLRDFQTARAEHDMHDPTTRYPYLRSLLNVYAVSSAWLNSAICSTNLVNAQRIPAARALSWAAGDKLAELLQCSVDMVDMRLQKLYTLQITDHGRHCDGVDRHGQRKAQPWEIDNLVYLSDSEVAQYRIYFQGGKAYQYPIYDNSLPITTLAPCDTTAFTDHPAYQGGQQSNPEGVFGFAMTFNRLMYAAVHECEMRTMSNPNGKRFYHSSYIEGQPVLCTGCVGIDRGTINYLNNFSGHYQPPAVQMVHVLETFRTYGINLNNIKVDYMTSTGIVHGVSAPRFIETRGRMPLRRFIRQALERYDRKIKFNQSRQSRDAVTALTTLARQGESGEDNLQVGVRYYLGLDGRQPTGVVVGDKLKSNSSLYKYLNEQYQAWQGDTRWTTGMQAM